MEPSFYVLEKWFVPSHIYFIPDKVTWDYFVTNELELDLDEGPEFNSSAGRTMLFEHSSGDSIITVSVDPKKLSGYTDNEIKGILVHEATHVFDYLMEIMGENSPGEEIKAYMTQVISLQLFNMYDDYKTSTKQQNKKGKK